MELFYFALKLLLQFIGIILLILFVINFVETIKIFVHCLRIYDYDYAFEKRFARNFMNYKHFGILNVAKWVILDIFRGKSYFKLYGIWAFTGYYGEGKSLGEVNFAFMQKKKHPELNIKIYSNFNVKGQDGKIEKWEDILELPPNTILLFDEIQSTFSSTKFKDFPMELLWKLTQCRKHGLAIFCTTPVFSRMSIQLRESVDFVITSKNVFKLDRLFKYSFFRADEYEKLQNSHGLFDGLKKKQAIEFTYTLVARDLEYRRYDTKEQIERMDVVDDQPVKSKTLNVKQLENDIVKKVISEIEKRGGLRSA